MISGDWLAKILEASRSLHGSGSMSPAALVALAKRLESRAIQRSVETGAGASTFVFSHLSASHTVFTLDSDGSKTAVKGSPLLKPGTTSFVDGPTQKTLPVHQFSGPLQAALIDGPHAYPFPELEYFYLYPHIEKDGLLVIDDIHIPSIQSLYRFLRCEDMFRLEEVCGKTAFFERTAAATFDPWGDGWWLQGFNRRTIWRYSLWDRVKAALPARLRPFLRRQADSVRTRRGGRR